VERVKMVEVVADQVDHEPDRDWWEHGGGINSEASPPNPKRQPVNDLRERLAAAEREAVFRASHEWAAGRTTTASRIAEERADRAIAVFVTWLRDEATKRAEAVQREDLDLLLADKVGLSTQVYAGRLHEADVLRAIADAIDPQPERTAP
jgi:hypothetical protein